MNKYRRQYRKPRRELHPLYETILRNHLHLLPQKKLAVLRDIYEQLPNRLECLDHQFIDETFGHLSPAKRKLLNLRLRPLEIALGRNFASRTVNLVKTTDQPELDLVNAVITVLRVTREKIGDGLVSRKTIQRNIAEYLGVELRKANYSLVRSVVNELIQLRIIESWDERNPTRLFRVNISELDKYDRVERLITEPVAPVIKEKKKRLICSECGMEFVYHAPYLKHMSAHKNPKTPSEILAMSYVERWKLYKTLTPEQREEAKQMVKSARRSTHDKSRVES